MPAIEEPARTNAGRSRTGARRSAPIRRRRRDDQGRECERRHDQHRHDQPFERPLRPSSTQLPNGLSQVAKIKARARLAQPRAAGRRLVRGACGDQHTMHRDRSRGRRALQRRASRRVPSPQCDAVLHRPFDRAWRGAWKSGLPASSHGTDLAPHQRVNFAESVRVRTLTQSSCGMPRCSGTG